MADEVTLTLPREPEFQRVAHLVLGGLAVRLNLTIENLEDMQIALDSLPRTADNIAFIEKVQPAVRKYADIGVRIEDSFLLEESGLHNLSNALPKTIDDIEALMRQRAK